MYIFNMKLRLLYNYFLMGAHINTIKLKVFDSTVIVFGKVLDLIINLCQQLKTN